MRGLMQEKFAAQSCHCRPTIGTFKRYLSSIWRSTSVDYLFRSFTWPLQCQRFCISPSGPVHVIIASLEPPSARISWIVGESSIISDHQLFLVGTKLSLGVNQIRQSFLQIGNSILSKHCASEAGEPDKLVEGLAF